MPIPIFDDIPHAQRTILRRVAFDEIEVTPEMLDRNEQIFFCQQIDLVLKISGAASRSLG